MTPIIEKLVKRAAGPGTVLLVAVAVVGMFAWLLYTRGSPLAGLEWRLYDSYYALHGPYQTDGEVVIVSVDEESLSRLGHWPWDRKRLAEMVENLDRAGAAMIMFDIIFPESTPSDSAFGEAIARSGRVVIPLAFTFDRETWDSLDPFVAESSFYNLENRDHFAVYPPIVAPGILPPVPELTRPAFALGSVQVIPDEDGVLRWEVLAVEYDAYLYPSAALMTAAGYLGLGVEDITYHAGEKIAIGDERALAVDGWGRTLIPYSGAEGRYPYLSASDVVLDEFDRDQVAGRIVLVGATAVGLYDIVVSPYSAAMPGVEKHANLITAILQGRGMRVAPDGVHLGVLSLFGLFFVASAWRLRAKWLLVSALTLTVSLFLLGYAAFLSGVLIMTLHAQVMLGTGFLLALALKYLGEEHRASEVRALFANYVTERVVGQLIRNPEIARLGGQRKRVTIMFTDIRNFTSFSESHSPEAVVTALNEYLGEMTEAVFHYEGTLDKYIGDAVMAFWGAPLEQPDQARRAVECALEMLDRLDRLNEKWRDRGLPSFEIGIGINTGEVLVGNVGAYGKKMDYTVIGDGVNLASRTESLNKEYGTRLLITLNTVDEIGREHVVERYGLRDLGEMRVKGKGLPVRFYALHRKPREDEDEDDALATGPGWSGHDAGFP